MITAATQITTATNKWRVSSPSGALQFAQTPAALDSIVGHSRRSYLWKCYYFVTKASPLCKSLQWPPPRRLPFSRQQSFCWNRHPAFKHRKYLAVKWSFSEEEYAFHCDYTWMSNSCGSYLITASRFTGWRRARFTSAFFSFFFLGNRRKEKGRCSQEKCLIHELILFISHAPLMFNTCFSCKWVS